MIIRFLDEGIVPHSVWHTRTYECWGWLKQNAGECFVGWNWTNNYRYVEIYEPEIAALFILKFRV